MNTNNFSKDTEIEEKKETKYEEPKIDILAEINKMQNAPIPDISTIINEDKSRKNEETNFDDILETRKEEKDIERTSEDIGNNKEEGHFSKIGELFSKFGNKKKEESEDIDETKNFIADIYNKNEKKDNKENLEETKKIDLSQINEKMKELDELKIEPDYKDFNEMYALTFGKTIKEEPKVEEKSEEYNITEKDLKTVQNVSIFEKLPKNDIPSYKYIGIAFSTYIIIEMEGELYIIDQHAAHERIMYEKIKANYYNDENKDSQLMLLPDIINLSHKDMQIAKDNMEIFEKAGFILEEFGENTIKLSGVPTVCLELDNKELFLETLDEINTVARTAKQEIEEKFIATVACKAAVKANMALTKDEVDNLMKQLLVLQNPFTCPHGRPTAIRMTKSDIEKKFSRR